MPRVPDGWQELRDRLEQNLLDNDGWRSGVPQSAVSIYSSQNSAAEIYMYDLLDNRQARKYSMLTGSNYPITRSFYARALAGDIADMEEALAHWPSGQRPVYLADFFAILDINADDVTRPLLPAARALQPHVAAWLTQKVPLGSGALTDHENVLQRLFSPEAIAAFKNPAITPDQALVIAQGQDAGQIMAWTKKGFRRLDDETLRRSGGKNGLTYLFNFSAGRVSEIYQAGNQTAMTGAPFCDYRRAFIHDAKEAFTALGGVLPPDYDGPALNLGMLGKGFG